MKGKVLDKKIAKSLSQRLLPSITIQNGIHLADRRRAPSIGFFEDSEQYFDSEQYAIHLGIYGPLDIFEVETEEEYISAVEYFYGHENQHVRSTAKSPYEKGISRSMFEVVEYIAREEGIRKSFRNEKDYEAFVSVELPKRGINVSVLTIMKICSHLMNAVEDGRIERIRSLEFPGFERQRRYFRAVVWQQEMKFIPYAKGLNAEDKLNLFIVCILSLATTGLYPKGFVVEYGSTEIMDEVQKFMPYIAKGVLAGRTRDMADNVVQLAKLLAPYIYEVSKFNPSEAEKAFKKMLEEMLKRLISAMDPSQMADTSEREEEQDDGVPMSVFPQSDLCIELDDDAYDKLMEKAKKSSGGNGAGIMVKRKHPKEDGKSSQKGESSGSGSGSGKDNKEDKDGKNGAGSGKDDKANKKGQNGSNSDKENSQDGKQGSNSDKENSQDGKRGSSGSQDGKQGSSGSQSSQGEQNGSQSNQSSSQSNGSQKSSQKGPQGAEQPYDKTYQRIEGAGCANNQNGPGNHTSGGGEDGTVEMVKQQMEEAAAECQYDASEKMSTINQSVEHSAHAGVGSVPVIENSDRPITKEDVKDICSRGFEELRRKYALDRNLPPVLAARAKAFRKKNERYFKSLSTPNVTHQDSGSIDPSRIVGLGYGETDIFRKIGSDKKFNGCVYILVDNSGSMGTNKRMEAAKAAAVVEEGFKGLLPLKIVAFDVSGPIIHEVIKGWDESQKKNCCWNFAVHGRHGCGNDDAKDILIAQKELLGRPEEKKLLIVLSDGAPASIEDTKRAVEATRKSGINVFSIYFEEGQIGSDAKDFQYMYQKDYVCCELADVDNQLTKLMMKFSRS